MYFLPRNNKFFSYIAHIKPNSRYGYTLAVCASFITIWMLAVHLPLQQWQETTYQ